MGDRVLEFLENWVVQNIRATNNAADKTVEVERLIDLFKQHAKITGIRDTDIQQATADIDLGEYMRRATALQKS